MFRKVLTLCIFVGSSAAQSPQGRPPEALARSLLNVTDYLSNYLGDPAGKQPDPNGNAAADANAKLEEPKNDPISNHFGGGKVSFLKEGKMICDVKAQTDETGGPKYLHLVVGNLDGADLNSPATAYVMRVEWDAQGELLPKTKARMDAWDQKLNGNLRPALSAVPEAQSAKEEAVANQGKSRSFLGKAKLAPGLPPTSPRIIFTGGTNEHEDVVTNGGIYFTFMNDAYHAILDEAGKPDYNNGREIHSLVMNPLAFMGSFNPKWFIDKDVLTFYTANVLTHHLVNVQTSLNDIYLVMPDDPEVILSLCKYCQYRSLTPIADLGGGICNLARQQVGGASIASIFFALLVAAWW